MMKDRRNEIKISSTQQILRQVCQGNASKTPNKLKNQIQKLLEEKNLLDFMLTSVTSKGHAQVLEKHMQTSAAQVQIQKSIAEVTETTKVEIRQIKSQLCRLDKEEFKLKRSSITDFEYKMLKSRNQKSLERRASRLHASKVKEGSLISEIGQTKDVIYSMLCERALFKKVWNKTVKDLAFHKRFLVDLIERSMIAITQNQDYFIRLRSLKRKATDDKKFQSYEKNNLLRLHDTINLQRQFLGTKGHQRELAPVFESELKRKELVQISLTSQFNLYKEVTENILDKFSIILDDHIIATPNVQTKATTDTEKVQFLKQFSLKFEMAENNILNHFRYLTNLMIDSDLKGTNLETFIAKNTLLGLDQKSRRLLRIEKGKNLMEQLTETEEMSNKIDVALIKAKTNIQKALETILEIMHRCNCNTTFIEEMLGEKIKINNFNIKLFLSTLEQKLNTMLSFVYYRKSIKQKTQSKLKTKTTKRAKKSPVAYVSQCSECAEREDVNHYDEATVFPTVVNSTKTALKEKVLSNELQYRLHTLSKCRLPRSRLLVNKRFQ